MKCPCCAAAELVHDTRDETHAGKDGVQTIIPEVRGNYCLACGESLLRGAETQRAIGVLRAAIQAGTNSGPGVDAKPVFGRLEHKYGR